MSLPETGFVLAPEIVGSPPFGSAWPSPKYYTRRNTFNWKMSLQYLSKGLRLTCRLEEKIFTDIKLLFTHYFKTSTKGKSGLLKRFGSAVANVFSQGTEQGTIPAESLIKVSICTF